MKIPVFHDDQHGTSIIVGAALLNGLKVVGKKIEDIKLVASGAGAAALACLDMLVTLGVRMENIIVTDIAGVVYQGRAAEMDDNKARYARAIPQRTLSEVIAGADAFLGLSAGNVLTPEMVQLMAARPLIFALANPTPEIMPEEAWPYVKVMATGRSDYPNQINNVLCFPGIFRGALDCRATDINEEMKLAAAHAIASVIPAEELHPEHIIPSVFNRQVAPLVARAVEEAARRTGVARRERSKEKSFDG